MKKDYTKVGLHLERQKFTNESKKAMFKPELVDKHRNQQYLEVNNDILAFGINHTEAQSRALEAVQRLFTDTNYKGNADPVEIGNRSVRKLPVLQFRPAEFLEMYGWNKKSRGDREHAIKALESLGTKQYFFCYDRLVYDGDGNVELDSKGRFRKETVTMIDTIIKLKKVYHEDSKRLGYYEVTPSMIFVDQIGLEEWDEHNIGRHFLLKPAGWREEIRLKVGRKASKYTYAFIEWLMVQFEDKRRSKGGYTIRMNWTVIAGAIKIPDKVIRKHKNQARGILHKAYTLAKDLGYLKSYETGEVDELILDKDRYPRPSREE